MDNAIARVAIKLGGSMLSEGFEEGLTEILTPWFKNMTAHANESVDWNQVAYSSLLGAVTAGLFETTGTISAEVNTYNTGKALQGMGNSVQALADLGSAMDAETAAFRLAGKVDENTGAYTVGRLFHEVGATLTEQNKADVVAALEQKGYTGDSANILVEAIAAVAEGAALSQQQAALLEVNTPVAQTMMETFTGTDIATQQVNTGFAIQDEAMQVAQPNTPGMETASTGGQPTIAQDQAAMDSYLAALQEAGYIEPGQFSAADMLGYENGSLQYSQPAAPTQAQSDNAPATDDGSASNTEMGQGSALRAELERHGLNSADIDKLEALYDPAKNGSEEQFARDMTLAFRLGSAGVPLYVMKGHSPLQSLTKSQLQTVRGIGEAFGKARTASQQQGQSENLSKKVENIRTNVLENSVSDGTMETDTGAYSVLQQLRESLEEYGVNERTVQMLADLYDPDSGQSAEAFLDGATMAFLLGSIDVPLEDIVNLDETKNLTLAQCDAASRIGRDFGFAISANNEAQKRRRAQKKAEGQQYQQRTKAEIARRNKKTGDAFEAEYGETFRLKVCVFNTQVVIETSAGKIRADVVTIDENGVLHIYELKSSETARLSKNQAAVFREIYRNGGEMTGKKKEVFGLKFTIPPGTIVEIIRGRK